MLPWLAWPEDFSSLGDAGIHLEILGQQQTCQYFFSILHLVCYDQKPTSSSLQHILMLRLMRAHKSHFVTFILQLKDQIFYFTLLPLELLLGQTQLQLYLCNCSFTISLLHPKLGQGDKA